MKRAIVLIAMVLLLISSCTNVSEKDNSIGLNYFEETTHTSTIVENSENIFFAANDGVFSVSKNNSKKKKLADISKPCCLHLAEGSLYFMSQDKDKVFCVKNADEKATEVFSVEKVSNQYGSIELYDFSVVGDVIYFGSPLYLFSYNIKTDEITDFLGNIGSDVFDVFGDKLYYIEHCSKTFTLYSTDISTKKVEAIKGLGVSRPDNTIIKNFIRHNNALYYCSEESLNMADDYSGTAIFNGEVCGLYSNEAGVYFMAKENGSYKLYFYNGKDCGYIVELSDFFEANGFSVVNNCLYYANTDETVVMKSLVEL